MKSDDFNLQNVEWRVPGTTIDPKLIPNCDPDDQLVESFHKDGVALVRDAFIQWVEPLRTGLQRNLDQPEKYAFPCESNPRGQPGRFFDSYCNWQLIPEYLDFLAHSCVASMAGRFMGSTKAQFFHDHVFMKSAGTAAATPWHQDLPYYCVDGSQSASVYVSLDIADKEIAVRFIRGSHRWNEMYFPRIFSDGSDFNDDPNNLFKSAKDIDRNRDLDIVSWDLNPGDAIIFDFRTLHGTTATTVKSTRRAFSTRWLGDDMKFCQRPGQVSPNFTNHGMNHGDLMREDWFPVLWSKK